MATLKDVSKETGLSMGTVSRVLNNRGYISQETRDKVDAAMKKLNYQPNELARSLSLSTSTILGIIIPSLANPYFANLVQYLEEAAAQEGYQSMVYVSNGKLEREKLLLNQCQKNRVAGIILASSMFSTLPLKHIGVPVVTIERPQEFASASIECDNRAGGKLAASHLVGRGCSHLLAITNVQGNTMPADDRTLGFVEEAQRSGIEHHEVQYSEAIYESMDYHEFLTGILSTFPHTDGLFCSNDIMAAQALQVLQAMGRKVPQDIKVIGFDDIPLASMLTPPLTTIRQPLKAMAQMAVSTFLGAKNGTEGLMSVKLSVQLVQRQTT